MGPGMVDLGTGIVPLPAHPSSHPGYTPSLPGYTAVMHEAGISGLNSAVGLKSVEQLTLDGHFSDIRTITEVYNLYRIDNR